MTGPDRVSNPRPEVAHQSIAVSGVHPARLDDEELIRECTLSTGRVSGPGGQHRNRVETAVFLTHTPTGVSTQATERRSQRDNKRTAIRRLRLCLAVRVRSTISSTPSPSDRWRARSIGQRLVVSANHSDYPELLAEALDVVTAHRFDVVGAAAQLAVSTTQLVRFIGLNKSALASLNGFRASAGLRPLRA